MITIQTPEQAEPPLICRLLRRVDRTARSLDATLRSLRILSAALAADGLWLGKWNLWIYARLGRAYQKELVSGLVVAMLLVSLNPASTAHAAYAAGAASADPIQLSEFTYSTIEEVDTSRSDGFLTKPILVTTSIGRPEQEQRERQRAEAERAAAQRRRSEQTRRIAQVAHGPAEAQAGQVRSEGNSYSRGYCTWWVKQRRPDIPNQWGNASAWLRSATRSGYVTGTVPQVGAVVVTAESRLGHVGYVETVEGNEIVVSDMNVIGWNKVSKRRMGTQASVILGYIY